MHPRGISLFRAPGISRWIVTTLAVAAVILSTMTATVAATAADGGDAPTTSEQPQDAATPEETEPPVDSPTDSSTEPPVDSSTEPDAPSDSSDDQEPSGEVLEPVTPVDPVDPQATLAGFSAGNIISDAVFTDKGTMTEAQIQAFFDSKVKTCRAGSDSYGPIVCLKDYRTDSVNRPADAYCKGYTGAKRETAARIIHRVAQSCNINPRVLIVMLQKEQSLVTHTWPSAWRYDKALGQGCPDDASCNPAYVGFFHQIYGAARQMQIYMEGRYFTWYAPGKTWNIRYDVEVRCGSSPVYISNKATSAMYYYTPYQPNAASLKAGYGSGDSCSSYGNRNFYNYFTDWFGSTHTADVCAVPGTVTSASRQYVTTTGLNARMAPSTSCDKGVTTLETGTILQGRRVTADGAWIEVTTPSGARWVSREFLRYADSAESACVVAAGTSARSGEYVVRSATTGRIAPWTGCGLRSVPLGKNTVLPALQISATGNWVQLSTPSGPRWVLSSTVAPATSADVATACAAPGGTSALSDRFVVNADASLLVSPLATCGVRSRDVGAGTVVQGERLSYSGKWVQVATSLGSRWLSRDAVTQCTDPAGTKRLDKQYVVALSTSAYVSPVGACGPGAAHWGTGTTPLKLSVGTLLEATRISYTGSWIEVRTASGLRWVKTSALDLASSNDVADACADPAGTTTLTDRFVVESTTAMKVSPLASCTTGSRDVGKGTVVQAQRLSYSGKWVQITTSSGPRWVARDAVAACANPAGTKSTAAKFTVSKSTPAYVSPIGACGPSAAYWGTGTAPLKLSAGETLQATRISYTGSWVEVRTSSGTRWVRAADLTQR